jgi:hypothetical protein
VETTFEECVDRVGRYGAPDRKGSSYGFWSDMFVRVVANGKVYRARDDGRFAWKYWGVWKRPAEPAGSDQSELLTQIADHLSGKIIRVSWREGGSYYGTYFTVVTHLCNSSRYALVRSSEKRTVEDNVQRNSWQETGTWDIVQSQGQVALRIRSTGGSTAYLPIIIASDGTFSFSQDGRAVTLHSPAQCG